MSTEYTKCEAVLNTKGKVCGLLVVLPKHYCEHHEYFDSFSEALIIDIKNNDGKAVICGIHRDWHNDINAVTGKAFAICNNCKVCKKNTRAITGCEWVQNFENKNKKTSKYKYIDGQVVKVEIARIKGYENFPKCTKTKEHGSLYCLEHQFVNSYTNDNKNDVSNCKYCNRIKLLVPHKNCCEACDKIIMDKNKKNRNVIQPENKCVAIIKGNQCRNGKVDGDYCQIHNFIEERNIFNNKMGVIMCELHNITVIDPNLTHSCNNCGISFVHGTSITINGDISNKCPYCILHLREYDSKRDRVGRDYKTYEAKPERKEARKKYKEENYELFTSYWIKARGEKILKLGVDEYHRQNNEYAKNRRLISPEKKDMANKLQSVNLKYKYGYYKRGAIDKGRIFELSYEECEKYFLGNCFYCNSEAIRGELLNGIDRLVNNIGYSLENCVTSCGLCNMMKGPYFNHIEFILACNHIMTHLGVIEGFYCPLVFRNSFSGFYLDYISSANKRGYDFKLTTEEFYSVISNNCYMCGKSNNNTHYNGIDRINNDIGYIFSNCKSCCTSCNFLKKNYNLHEALAKILSICMNYYDKPKIIKNIDGACSDIYNIKYVVNKVDHVEHVNNINHIDNVDYPNNNDDNGDDIFSDVKYLNELNILFDNSLNINQDNAQESINKYFDDAIDTLNNLQDELIANNDYTLKFNNFMTEQNINNEGKLPVSYNLKKAIEKRKIQHKIDKPINDEKLINSHTNSDIIEERIQKLVNKKTNKDIISEVINNDEQINYTTIMQNHKENTYNKLQEYLIIYKNNTQ
jgi:hypothetical protein